MALLMRALPIPQRLSSDDSPLIVLVGVHNPAPDISYGGCSRSVVGLPGPCFRLLSLRVHLTRVGLQSVYNTIRSNTVDRLKQIITGINEECSTNFAKSGKKQELIDRITYQLDSWKSANTVDKWQKAKTVIYQVRTSGL